MRVMLGLNWNEYFYYDETSPSGLRWNTVITSANGRPMTTVDSVAGRLKIEKHRKSNYYTLQLNNKKYRCHRVIWELHFDALVERQSIDHIDRNQLNNKISNLRIVNQKENCENRRMSSANKSGVTGVSLQAKGGCEYWCATWKINRKTKTKLFSIKKYGIMPAFALAVTYRKEKIMELNKMGANYTGAHGT